MIKKLRTEVRALVNNAIPRRQWVSAQLKGIPAGSLILDAGCGQQQYRGLCEHLDYRAQDFGKYDVDEKRSFAASDTSWRYGELDYVGDICDIDEADSTFDVLLCTEVLEHVPDAANAIKEFSRLLKPGGKLILTVPSNSLRHQDPYYFVCGFSDHYIHHWLGLNGFGQISVQPQGDYYQWLFAEDVRTIRQNGLFAAFMVGPAMIYRYFKLKKPTEESISTLCVGYHITAVLD